MGKIRVLIESLQTDAPRETALRIWQYIALRSRISGVVQLGISEVHKERLYAFAELGYWPRVREPRSFNEKVLHRKLYTDDPKFTEVADKLCVRSYVKEKVGDEILNDLYHVTGDPSTIPFDSLPEQFVIKSTHGWNHVIIVNDKTEADFSAIRSECREFLSEQYGEETNEYWYTRVEPKIIVEKYIQDGSYNSPRDFKFHVFDGDVELIGVHFNRFSNHTCRYYKPDWIPLDLKKNVPVGPDIAEPPLLDQMIDIAETLGDEFDFVRVDLYQPSGEQIAFGEMTIAPAAGSNPFAPPEYDWILGSYWP